MTKAEQASRILAINSSNRKLYGQLQHDFESIAQDQPEVIADALADFEHQARKDFGRADSLESIAIRFSKYHSLAAAKAKAKVSRGKLRLERREKKSLSARLAAKPPLRYRSPLRRAIAVALIGNPKARDLEVCSRLDEDGSVELDKADRSWVAEYRREKGSGSLHSTISIVRNDLRGRLRT